MGFEILIDTQAAEDRITGMLGKLQKVPVPAEFTEWQKQDMKRKYPTTEEINPTTAATTIYPRSPVKVQGHAHRQATDRQQAAHPAARTVREAVSAHEGDDGARTQMVTPCR
jgi:hypothetical protein